MTIFPAVVSVVIVVRMVELNWACNCMRVCECLRALARWLDTLGKITLCTIQ